MYNNFNVNVLRYIDNYKFIDRQARFDINCERY